MTRILAINNMYPPHHLGGYELSCRDVVTRWRRAGHDVLVLTTDSRVPGVADPSGESTDDVRRVLRFYWKDHVITSPGLRERLAIERWNERVLGRTVEEFRPDVVSFWHMGAMSLGLLTAVERAGIRMVLVVCDDWMLYGPDVDAWSRTFWSRPRLARIVERVTGLPASAPTLAAAPVLFISEWTKRRAEDRSRMRFATSSTVYNGIDTSDFPIAPRADRPWTWKLAYAGRVEERKGVHVIVQALRLLPAETTLQIDGRPDPAYKAHVEQIAREEGVVDRITFADTARASLREVYAGADAVVFAVLWDEPFGLVPIEAMASGTPVVATATGGSAEFLVDGGNALVVAKDDPTAMAAALRRLAADDELRRRLGRGGAITAGELTVDRFADVLTQWHAYAAAGSTGPPPPARALIPDVLAARGVLAGD